MQTFEFHTVGGLVARQRAVSFPRWAVLPRAKIQCDLVLFSSIIHLCTLIKWLRHCATSQKVAGSIPDGVIGIFH